MVRQEQEAWKQDATDNGFRGQVRVMTEGDRFKAGWLLLGFCFVCLFVSFWFVLWDSFCLFLYLFSTQKDIGIKIRTLFEVKLLVSTNVLLFLWWFFTHLQSLPFILLPNMPPVFNVQDMYGVTGAVSSCIQVQFEQRISSKSWAEMALVHENTVLLENIQPEPYEYRDKGWVGWLVTRMQTHCFELSFVRSSFRALLPVERIINWTELIPWSFVHA